MLHKQQMIIADIKKWLFFFEENYLFSFFDQMENMVNIKRVMAENIIESCLKVFR